MNTEITSERPGWGETFRSFLHPRVITMLFFGFSAGLPLLLIFSSLGLWLREAGLERSVVTLFSWAALGYSFKFIWAPLVDRLPLPFLTRSLGRRRAWLLVAQIAIIVALLWMASIDPANGQGQLVLMAMAAVMLGFSSATQDIVIDAYRIESAEKELQALMSATYIAGYRIGMLVAGAGALYLASYLGSERGHYLYTAWCWTYVAMAAVMLVGVITTLVIAEPQRRAADQTPHTTNEYLRFLLMFILAITGFIVWFYYTSGWVSSLKSEFITVVNNKALAGFMVESGRLLVGVALAVMIARMMITLRWVDQAMVVRGYVAPIRDFFERYGKSLAWLLLALIGTYRISDIVLGVISNVFYQDMGFTKNEIATVAKTFGLFMTIAGGFAGGLLAFRYGVMRMLFVGALLTVLTNLLFVLLANSEPDIVLLYLVISADNLTGGLATAAFIAFLSSLTNISFTAVQYAIFSSLMTLLPKVLGGYSGSIVDSIGYSSFFLFASALGVPVLLLVWWAARRFELRNHNN